MRPLMSGASVTTSFSGHIAWQLPMNPQALPNRTALPPAPPAPPPPPTNEDEDEEEKEEEEEEEEQEEETIY